MLYTQIDLRTYHLYRESYEADLKAMGNDVVLLSLCEFFEQGEERAEVLKHLSEALVRLKSLGYTVAVWTNSLGWGSPRSAQFHEQFGGCVRLTAFDGSTSTAVCTLDERFLEQNTQNTKDFIRAGADLILWDDDLVQSVRPGFMCTCPLHLSRFSRHASRTLTRDDVRSLFTGAPSQLRSDYLDLMGDSMLEYCRALRQAADEVDPSVRMGLCASFTHYDIEGTEIEKIVKVLAGRGNRPFFRISGATYWPFLSAKYWKYTLNDVMDFVRMQIGWLRSKDWEVFDENDSYPRSSWVVPASYIELYDKIVIANGGAGRHKYILCFGGEGPEKGDRRYLEAHLKNMEADKVLARMFEHTHPVGMYVHSMEHSLRMTTLPDSYRSNGYMFSRISLPIGAKYLNLCTIPAQFDRPGPGILTGHLGELVDERELTRGVLLDSESATHLAKRGFDVGATLGTDGSLIPAESAEILMRSDAVPRLWTYTSGSGHRFAVLNMRYEDMTDSTAAAAECPNLARALAKACRFIAGKPLPVMMDGAPGAYIVAAEDDEGERLSILICNIWYDAIERPKLTLDGLWTVEEELRTGATVNGSELTLSRIGPYEFAAVWLRRKH